MRMHARDASLLGCTPTPGPTRLDPGVSAVGGSQCGGGLMAWVALRARDDLGVPPVTISVLVYPS